MHALKARVENGRIKLDEPTDLPEDKVIELVPLDEVLLKGVMPLTMRSVRRCIANWKHRSPKRKRANSSISK